MISCSRAVWRSRRKECVQARRKSFYKSSDKEFIRISCFLVINGFYRFTASFFNTVLQYNRLIILDNDNLLYRFKSAKLHDIYLIWSFHSASVDQILFASYNKFVQVNVPLLPHVSMKPFQYIHSSFACSTNIPWTPLKRYVWLVILCHFFPNLHGRRLPSACGIGWVFK